MQALAKFGSSYKNTRELGHGENQPNKRLLGV